MPFKKDYFLTVLSGYHYAIPKHLLVKSTNDKLFAAESDDLVLDPTSFCLDSGVKLDLTKMKSKDFYWLLKPTWTSKLA